MRLGFLAVTLLPLASMSASLQAQALPSKPLRFIMAAPAGSSIDVLGRVLAERMRDVLGQAVVVDNMPGAGGTVATLAVAKAAPDAHTLGIAFNGPLAFAPYLYGRLGYDPQKDLVPIILATSQPNVLAVAAAMPVKTVAELIAYAKARPGKLNYASVGNGSSSHLTMELLKVSIGIDIAHVPYNGSPPALTALASGDAHALFAVPTAIAPLAQAGKVRMLAVSSSKRWPLLPELPPLADAGLPGFESFAWNGVIAPAGILPDAVQRLNRAIDAVLREPTIRARLNSAGLEPVGGSAEAFAALIRSEAGKWAPVIRRTGARID